MEGCYGPCTLWHGTGSWEASNRSSGAVLVVVVAVAVLVAGGFARGADGVGVTGWQFGAADAAAGGMGHLTACCIIMAWSACLAMRRRGGYTG